MAALTTIALVGGGASIAASTANAISSGNRAKKSKQEMEFQQQAMANLKASREAIKNPYEDISNQYANLSVATQAAEFQAEEADIALANTLDTLRATGAGAGGATALAQAALQSKRNISASIEKQEVSNARLRAQGAMTVQQQKAAGEQWRFATQDQRTLMDMDRAQALADKAEAQRNYERSQMWSAIGNIPGQIMSMGTNFADAKTAMYGNSFVSKPVADYGYGATPEGTTYGMDPQTGLESSFSPFYTP